MESSCTEAKKQSVHIRWMIGRDMPEILAIENASFEHVWFEEDFIMHLRQRNVVGMVAQYRDGPSDRIAGYMIYELTKSKIHLLNFAVNPELRRSGIGTQMVDKLIGKLSINRRKRITLKVQETNLDAQLFFRSLGFRATKVLRNYYEIDGSHRDAYTMERRKS